MQEKKYGLQIRAPKSQKRQQESKPLVPKPLIGFNDDDDNDVEREISRHAAKNKSQKDVDEQYKKALEEDPSIFDYDGVYDDMKAKVVQPKALDREQRQPKYIQALMEKAKRREREHEVVYERKLAKERTKEDHLYADKDKFVTKKSDITDFYFSLSKNVAFGANEKLKKQEREEKEPAAAKEELKKSENEPDLNTRVGVSPSTSSVAVSPSTLDNKHQEASVTSPEPAANPVSLPRTSAERNPLSSDKPKQDHHKKSEEAIAAAKERFLARKKAKMQ
ncbi:Nuclear speckle splicing regulatory protein 1 [Bienertia sinuspersici]